MTQSEAMLAECLDEVEEVLQTYRHRRFTRENAWASSVNRAFKLDDRIVTMTLTIDVSAPEQKTDDSTA
jgi:hypothetical protein